jgi:transcriptional regulator with XRE-family HTH domain
MTKGAKKLTVFAKRLRQARDRTGLTQMQFGVFAGIEEFSASARINQYENAIHTPRFETAKQLSVAAAVPPSFLYEPNDTLADIILAAGDLSEEKRLKLLQFAERLKK